MNTLIGGLPMVNALPEAHQGDPTPAALDDNFYRNCYFGDKLSPFRRLNWSGDRVIYSFTTREVSDPIHTPSAPHPTRYSYSLH